jgi:hypothetical protein
MAKWLASVLMNLKENANMLSALAIIALCYIQWRAIKEIKSLTKKNK